MLRASCVAALLALAAGCVGSPPPPSGMTDLVDASLRSGIPSNARFVLRVPRVADRVSESASSAKWDELERGLYGSGLNLVDRGLLEQLLQMNAMPSYGEIRSRTGADVIIEVIDVSFKLERLQNTQYACEVSTATSKLVDVAQGAVIGTVTATTSSCPVTEKHGEDPRSWLFRCHDFLTGSNTTDVYRGPGGSCPAGTEWVLLTNPNSWTTVGGQLAQALRAQMTAPPVPEQAPVATVSPPSATATGAQPAPPAQIPSTSLEARLEKLKQLRESGVITEAEYEKMRQQVLSEF